MQLAEYLKGRNLTLAEFGSQLGVDPTAVMKWRVGLTFPSPENLRRIREATGGAVTADDFVDQHVQQTASAHPHPEAA